MSEYHASLEVRHSDANHALFMVLKKCCQMILDVNEGSETAVTIIARNLRESGRTKMADGEIAECAYRLALGLKEWKRLHAFVLNRVVVQILLADRWEAKLRR